MHDISNILVELGFILLHFLLFAANFRLMKGKIMHPSVLFSLIWWIILLLHFVFKLTLLPDLFSISYSTFLIFFIGTVAFSLGGFIQKALRDKKFQRVLPAQHFSRQVHSNLRTFLVAILLIGLPFYIMAAYRVFVASNISNFLVGLRTELSYGIEEIGPTKYLVSLSYVVFAVNLYSYFINKTKKNTLLLLVNVFVTIAYAFFVTGRGLFLELLLIYMGLAIILDESFSLKKISTLFLFFMTFFVGIGIIYGKGGSQENTLKENLKPAVEMTAVYLVSPLNAFEWEKHHQFQINYQGNYSLRFFKKIAEQLDIVPNTRVVDLTRPFVFVPYPTNVYTVYSPYVKDFGNFYAWVMLFMFGWFHSFLYFKAVSTKRIRYSIYYSFLLFPLVMSFFEDQYLSLFSSWLQVAFYFEVILFINQFFFSSND